jgi:hypothetical protein
VEQVDPDAESLQRMRALKGEVDAPMKTRRPVKTAQDELREAEEAERAAREAAAAAEEAPVALEPRTIDGAGPSGDHAEDENGAMVLAGGSFPYFLISLSYSCSFFVMQSNN